MKIKRIIAAFAAAVVMGTSSVTCFAIGDGEATYCFDTADKISDWQTYGSVDETGFKIKQNTAVSQNGEGSIVISESVSDDIANTFGGAFITADTVGLADFGGCTISMSVLLTSSAEGRIGNFSLYSDGMIWLEAAAPEDLNSKTWTDIVLQIPADVSNTKVGFTIPTYDVYMGDVLYIDDFSIIDANGKAIKNVGDYKMKAITVEGAVPGWVNIVLIAVLVLLVAVIVIGIVILIKNNTNKFH